mgnify:CR=1 FL=1
MVKHIVAWQLKEGIDLPSVTAKMKEKLEGLVGKVEGLNFAEVLIDKGMGSVVLISELDSFDALKGYATHPEHVKVADTYVRPFTASRTAVDCEI